MQLKATLFACALALFCSTAWADDEAYRLGKGDSVQIMTFGHEELSGDFEVDANGFLKFPLLGRVRAEGLSLTELEEALKGPLGERFIVDPKISANILEYSPIYVMGDVAAPAMYAYEPGLTVLHAVALAGGYGIQEPMDVAIQMIGAQEEFRVAFNTYRAGLARVARLESERDGLEEIAFPDELILDSSDPLTSVLIDTETRIFATRSEALIGDLQLLDQQKELFRQEISALRGQLAATRKQADLTKLELKDLEELSEKGLARRPQLLMIQRNLAGFEGERTQLGAFIARAKQQIARTDQEILNRQTGYRNEILMELSEMQTAMAQLELRLKAARDSLDQLRVRVPLGLSASHDQKRSGFIITRNRGAEPKEIAATETTLVLPGDVVRVPYIEQEEPALPQRTGDAGTGFRSSVTYAEDGRVRMATEKP